MWAYDANIELLASTTNVETTRDNILTDVIKIVITTQSEYDKLSQYNIIDETNNILIKIYIMRKKLGH